MLSAPLRDNLLFGRVAYGLANAEQKISAVLREVAAETGVDALIRQVGLDTDAGIGGRALPPSLRQAVGLARSLVKQPQILALDNVPAGLGSAETKTLMKRLTSAFAGKTLIATMGEAPESGFDLIVTFEGNRVAGTRSLASDPVPSIIAPPEPLDTVNVEDVVQTGVRQ